MFFFSILTILPACEDRQASKGGGRHACKLQMWEYVYVKLWSVKNQPEGELYNDRHMLKGRESVTGGKGNQIRF